MFGNVSYILFINPGAYSDRSGHGFEPKQIYLPIPGGSQWELMDPLTGAVLLL